MGINNSLLVKSKYSKPYVSEKFKLDSRGITSFNGEISLMFDDENDLIIFKEIFEKGNYSYVPEFEHYLNLMTVNGMLRDVNLDGKISWVNICHDLFYEVIEEMLKFNLDDNVAIKIINKRATNDEVREWVRRCFFYTRSAYDHISGVIENKGLNENEKKFWEDFRADEMNHWKMYSKIFDHLGLKIEEIFNEPCNAAVKNYVMFLYETGKRSMYEYGGLLFMMEQSPEAEIVEDDPLYGTLISYYKFPKEVVLPLWNHTIYNGESAHNDIWFNVIRSKETYSLNEKKSIIDNAKIHCRLCYEWNKI